MLLKHKRHRIYKKMYEHMQESMLWGNYDSSNSLCINAADIQEKLYPNCGHFHMDDFPELYKHKPARFGNNTMFEISFWWPLTLRGLRIRMAIVKEAIKSTTPVKRDL